MSTAGSKDTTSVKGTTTATATTAVKATTDVNGTSGRQGATGSVSGNDETPAPSSCAKVILRQDSCASCSYAPPLPVMAVPALLFLRRRPPVRRPALRPPARFRLPLAARRPSADLLVVLLLGSFYLQPPAARHPPPPALRVC
jgi:hypothetical protein